MKKAFITLKFIWEPLTQDLRPLQDLRFMKKLIIIFFTASLILYLSCLSKTTDDEGAFRNSQSDKKGEIFNDAEISEPYKSEKSPTMENNKIGRSVQTQEFQAHSPADAKREAESIITVIEKLEDCYKNNDFDNWLDLLTPRYRERYNDPELLAEEGWNVRNIGEFFNLLVDTRKKENIRALRISRVDFINPNKAYVYVFLENEEFPKPQHTFIKVGDSWLKGLSKEGD